MTTTSGLPGLVPFRGGSADGPATVCIPWAGAGAAPFQEWVSVFGADAEVFGVRLPGRESRIDEVLPGDVELIRAGIARDVAGLGRRRVLLFGLCSGGLLAFEVARALGPDTVAGLYVASQLPPAVAARVATEELGSTEDLVARYLSDELLAEPELVEMLVEILRADIEAVSRYRHDPTPLPGVPVTVFRGGEDVEISLAEMDDWHAASTGPVRISEVPGAGHLFRGAAWRTLAARIHADLFATTGHLPEQGTP